MKYFTNCRTLEELKTEYRKLAMANHPDKGGTVEAMQQINAEHDEMFELLKDAHNATCEPQYQTTETAEEFRAIIDALLKLDGLNVELCGRWLWISGDTKQHKDALKLAGCKWSQSKLMWYWRHEEDGGWHRGNKSINQIRNKYGSQMFTADGSYKEYRREEISA